eukprot:1182929-Prorocentrum_minimum.AAC.1
MKKKCSGFGLLYKQRRRGARARLELTHWRRGDAASRQENDKKMARAWFVLAFSSMVLSLQSMPEFEMPSETWMLRDTTISLDRNSGIVRSGYRSSRCQSSGKSAIPKH